MVDDAIAKRWASREDWEIHRSTISSLHESMTLTQLKEHMEVNHGFSAT
jgi:hypothetical protein